MATGTVKWFSNAKGYGFIAPEQGGEDVFAHFSAVYMDGYKTLKRGQLVEFDISEGPKGLQASNIRPSGDFVATEMPTLEPVRSQQMIEEYAEET